MKRALLVSAVLGAVGLAPSVASAAVPLPSSADCGTRSETFLFWPKGHGRVPSAGFPAFRTPHMEIYRGANGKFPNSATDGVVQSNGAGVGKRCKVSAARSVKARVPSAGTTRNAKQIRCRFGQKVTFEFSKVARGTRMQAALPDGQVVVDVKLLRSGSSATYSTKLCKAVAPPR